MYPDNPITEQARGEFRLQVIQDLDRSTSEVKHLKQLNTFNPNPLNGVVILQAISSSNPDNNSGIPGPDGQYKANLLYGRTESPSWGDNPGAHHQFGSWHVQWNNTPISFSGSIVSEDRAFVHGNNLQKITRYISPNENGTYTTYND
tara:strand:+ start:1967 stop:2407 length:441 start_codon:yes stop_codon:yes gene_type:complete